MARDSKRGWPAIGCAALIGASIAFPLGVMMGGGRTTGPGAAPPGSAVRAGSEPRTARNPYSPRVVGDPYVIDQQRRVLQALELGCRQTRQHCSEAEQARRRIEEAESQR